MATTFVEYTGDGNATKQFTFPSYQESDVKVRVDGVLKTTGNHYNITSYTTTGGGNVVFTSGNIPSSPANIRIYRDTNVDAAKATFTAGSSVKAADLNNNTTQLLYRAQEEQIPNLIHSYDIDDSAIETSKIKDDAITSAKIDDDQINSQHYVDGSIDTQHIADAQITTAKIADSNVTTAKIADSNVTTAKIADNNVTADKLAHTSVTAGSYTAADITVDAQGRLTSAASGTIATGEIADSAVTQAKIANANVTTDKIADSNVTTAKIADNNVTMAKLASGALPTDITVASANIVDGTIGSGDLASSAVTTAKIADSAVTNGKINNLAVDNSKIYPQAVTFDKIATATIVSGNIADGNILTNKLGDSAVTTAKIADNAVTNNKIADAELKTLAGMPSATASKLADSTALTADIADLNQIDGMAKQTTVTDDDTKFPTSGAIVDYVALQLSIFGGFTAIANETQFPNTQKASGAAVSISDAGGLSVNGSGTSTSARTVGGATVTINNIPSSFHNDTVASGVRLIVTSTGSGQVYNYHKATIREEDLVNLSDDINDFGERYRVGSSNPTSNNDAGDLFFNTGSGKLLVYNATSSAWEETQSVGNFFINTISSSSGTGGGSATPNGTAYRFTISNAGANAEQHIVSVDGVIQKPNSGTSQPSEGFALDGGDIIFGSAPVNGASLFVITIGASVSIGTPSNNTVTSAILQNGSVTTAKIVDGAVTAAKIASQSITADRIAANAVGTSELVDGAVTAAKIASQSITADRIAAGAVATSELASNAVTTAKIANDAVTGVKIAAEIDNSHITATANIAGSKLADNSISLAKLEHGTSSNNGKFLRANNGADPTFETVNTDLVSDTSPQLGGDLASNGNDIVIADNDKIKVGTGGDLHIFHNGSQSKITDSLGNELRIQADTIRFRDKDDTDTYANFIHDGAVELYHDGTKKIETRSGGVTVQGQLSVANTSSGGVSFSVPDNSKAAFGSSDDLKIYHDGNSRLTHSGAGNLVVETTASGSDLTLRAQDDAFLQCNNGNEGVRCIGGGATELYYNNSRRFHTTSSGAYVTGDLTLTSNLVLGDNDELKLGASSDMTIWHNGTDFNLYNSTGEIIFSNASGGGITFKTNSNNTRAYLNADGHFYPAANNTFDLGTSSNRWRNIYANDLNLSNQGASNEVDGTWGDWTIQEGESDLFLKNNRSGKKYKFNLTEVS